MELEFRTTFWNYSYYKLNLAEFELIRSHGLTCASISFPSYMDVSVYAELFLCMC